jgi:Domain of unknown function (DUF4920)
MQKFHALSLSMLFILSACPKAAEAPASVPAPKPAPSSQPAKTAANVEAAEEHHAGPGLEAREVIDADGVIRRGQKLSETVAVSVSGAKAKASELDGKTIKVQGKVESVCQAMGCWFVMQGETPEDTIRITSKGHDIFVPRAAAGRVAVVEGEFKVKTLDKAIAQHFEDERPLKAGEQKKTITEDQKELSLAVTALEMKPG